MWKNCSVYPFIIKTLFQSSNSPVHIIIDLLYLAFPFSFF